MSETGSKRGAQSGAPAPVDFLARFTASEKFAAVFREGMGLVEETANYLDGPGRVDVRGLDRHGSVAYATESMRLTTRLMQLASWLLLQRAVSAGELNDSDALAEKRRINLAEIGPGQPLAGGEQLPEALTELVSRSLKLHERIMTLDLMLAERDEAAMAPDKPHPLADQLTRLHQAFPPAARGA